MLKIDNRAVYDVQALNFSLLSFGNLLEEVGQHQSTFLHLHFVDLVAVGCLLETVFQDRVSQCLDKHLVCVIPNVILDEEKHVIREIAD